MPAPRLVDHFEDIKKQSDAARLGIWVFIGSETLLFGALIALYASYRAMYPADFAAAVGHTDVAIGTTNTLVLITSSLTVALAVGSVLRELPRLAGWLGEKPLQDPRQLQEKIARIAYFAQLRLAVSAPSDAPTEVVRAYQTGLSSAYRQYCLASG